MIFREIMISRLTFVKLADSDNLEKQDDFREMARFFQDLSMKRKSEEEENNVLISVLKDCVTNKSSNVFFSLVSGSPSIYGPCVQSMKVPFIIIRFFIIKIVHAKITRIFINEKI